jgi:hypothetical protein
LKDGAVEGWTGSVEHRVKNEEALPRVEERTLLHPKEVRKANWIGHILRRNCLLKYIIEGKPEGRIEVTGGRRRRCI